MLRTLTLHTTYSRQHILTTDGATLGLDWFNGCDADGPGCRHHPSDPVLLVCHGINGGSHEGYAKWVCAAAAARGWRAVVLNYRGCNGLPFTAPRGYAATLSHDVFTAVYSVRARFPTAPLLAVGYSLGGLKLTKYVAEADAGLHMPPPGLPHLFSGSGLAAAAVVSSPVSLGHSASKLSDTRSLNFLYNLAVAYKLREHLATHRADIAAVSAFDVDSALASWTMIEIEEQGLPASFGFASRQQYYEAASSPDYIPAIQTPTLLLLAEDDPFLGVVPDAECSRNPNTLLALTRRGGHVAFLQGSWPLGRAYMDDAVLEFFAVTMEHLHRCDPRVCRPPAASPAAAAAATAAQSGPAAAAAMGHRATGPEGPGGGALVGRRPDGAVVVSDAVRAGAAAAAVAAATRPWAFRCCEAAGQCASCGPAASAAGAAPQSKPEASRTAAAAAAPRGGATRAEDGQARRGGPGRPEANGAAGWGPAAAAQLRILAQGQREAERARALRSEGGDGARAGGAARSRL